MGPTLLVKVTFNLGWDRAPRPTRPSRERADPPGLSPGPGRVRPNPEPRAGPLRERAAPGSGRVHTVG